jgi:hypothetical protein
VHRHHADEYVKALADLSHAAQPKATKAEQAP